jgi:integrase
MAIQLYCHACKTYVPVASKKCPKCGTVFPREGRKYRVDVTVKGRRVTRFCDNLTIAREVEGTIRGDLVRGEYDITVHKAKKVVTLGDVWEKYLPWAKDHKKSWRDDQYYYSKHLLPRFGSKPLDGISAFDIEKMKTELKNGVNKRGQPYAAQTIKHQIVILRRLFNLARKWDLYQGDNPVNSVQIPRFNSEKTEFMSDEEFERLMDTLETWPCKDSVAFIKFALFTGLRRGEIIKLRWDDVNFERNLVTLRDPKPGKDQTVPVSNEALNVLRGLETTSAHVFPGKNGNQRYDFKGPWEKIRKAASLPKGFRFHGLRHHFACTMVSNGHDLLIVKELLHHKDIKTTQRYAHVKPDVVMQAAMKSGELLSPKTMKERTGGVVRVME